MTACQRFGEWLDGYHDGELRGIRRWRVERHLTGCPACRAELGQLGRLGQLLREAGPAERPGELWQRIASGLAAVDARLRVERESAVSPRLGFARRLAPFAAGAALAAAVLVLLPWLRAEPTSPGVVRSLYSLGPPVVVLEDTEETTIIWVMDGGADGSVERGRLVLG